MVALVTGASKGIGKGIAIALAKKGYSVVVTGRDEGRLKDLKAEVANFGGLLEYAVCDHSDLEKTVSTFQSIGKRGFDVIVNNAWGGYERMVEDSVYTWENKFWDQPLHRWTSMMDVCVRTAFIASKFCVSNMLRTKSGTIINISFWAARHYMQNVLYGVSKAAMDKLSQDMAWELKEYNVAVVSLYPGLVRTEAVLANAEYFDMSNSESPEFSGLVIDRFVADPNRLTDSGRFLTTAELGLRYGMPDIDGKVILDKNREESNP